MSGTISFRLIALVAIVCLFIAMPTFAQISVRVEQVAVSGNHVAGSIVDMCYIHIRAQEDLYLRHFRISQVADPVFNRSVEHITVGYQEDNWGWGIQAWLDEDGNADFTFGGPEEVFIQAGQEKRLACVVALVPINRNGAQSGDVLQFVLRANQDFLAETEDGEQITSAGPRALPCGNICVRGNVPEVPELEVVQTLVQSDGSLINGRVDILHFQVSAAEGTDVALVKVPIRLHLEDSVLNDAPLYLGAFRVYEGSDPDNVQLLTEATTGEDAYAVWTADGQRVSRLNELLLYDWEISTHNLYIQFYDERIIPSGQTRYFSIRAFAGNVGTGAMSNDAISAYLSADDATPHTYYLDMHLDDEGEPQEEPLASLFYDNGEFAFGIQANDWIWSDGTGTDGDFNHRQYGQPSSQDYILGLRVCFPPLPQTIFSVFGNEYDGRRDQMGHQAGEVLGLWCGLSTDQIIGGIQFDLDIEGLVVDSVTIFDEMEEQGFEAVSRNNRVLVLCPEGQALAGQALNRFVTCWITIPEDAQGVYCILAENIIISSEEGYPVGVNEVHQGWFFVGQAGDINQDGELNILDLVRMINLILDGYQVWEGRVGDMNGDMALDVEDVVLLIDAILDGAGRDFPLLEPSEVWQGQLDDVWQYNLTNNQPVRAFQLTLQGDLEDIQPYLTERSEGMSIAYHFDPATRTIKLVVYSMSKVIQPGQGAVLVVPGEVEEVIFEKVVQVNPEGVPKRPFEGKPSGFLLQPAYPNPFNPKAIIGYSLSTSGLVNLTICDITGRKVTQLVNSTKSAGTHSVTFDAQGLATGVYVLRLDSSFGVRIQKLTLIK